MSSCCSDKWSMKDHLRIGGTKSLISVVHCERGCYLGWSCMSLWERTWFFFFSLPDFPGEVGRKTEQETALEFTFCPEDEGNALKSSFIFLYISSPKKQKRLKENHHLGVCVIYMQMLLCFYRGRYSFQDKTTESEGLWSLKSMCDVICVLFNLLSRPVSKQELGLSEIPGRLQGIFCIATTLSSDKTNYPRFLSFSPLRIAFIVMGQTAKLPQDHVNLATSVQEVPKTLFSRWSWRGIIP